MAPIAGKRPENVGLALYEVARAAVLEPGESRDRQERFSGENSS